MGLEAVRNLIGERGAKDVPAEFWFPHESKKANQSCLIKSQEH